MDLTHGQWQLVNELFHAAAGLAEEERAALVIERGGGDAKVAAMLARLLEADQAGPGPLDAGIGPVLATLLSSSDPIDLPSHLDPQLSGKSEAADDGPDATRGAAPAPRPFPDAEGTP